MFNIEVNINKCKFFKQNVELLSHNFGVNQVEPIKEKVEATKKAKTPTMFSIEKYSCYTQQFERKCFGLTS